jgi:hypothetical protein
MTSPEQKNYAEIERLGQLLSELVEAMEGLHGRYGGARSTGLVAARMRSRHSEPFQIESRTLTTSRAAKG